MKRSGSAERLTDLIDIIRKDSVRLLQTTSMTVSDFLGTACCSSVFYILPVELEASEASHIEQREPWTRGIGVPVAGSLERRGLDANGCLLFISGAWPQG